MGTTRSAWVNFRDCCAMMKRAQEHVVRILVAGRRLASFDRALATRLVFPRLLSS